MNARKASLSKTLIKWEIRFVAYNTHTHTCAHIPWIYCTRLPADTKFRPHLKCNESVDNDPFFARRDVLEGKEMRVCREHIPGSIETAWTGKSVDAGSQHQVLYNILDISGKTDQTVHWLRASRQGSRFGSHHRLRATPEWTHPG
jgi:hypothetical protein